MERERDMGRVLRKVGQLLSTVWPRGRRLTGGFCLYIRGPTCLQHAYARNNEKTEAQMAFSLQVCLSLFGHDGTRDCSA